MDKGMTLIEVLATILLVSIVVVPDLDRCILISMRYNVAETKKTSPPTRSQLYHY